MKKGFFHTTKEQRENRDYLLQELLFIIGIVFLGIGLTKWIPFDYRFFLGIGLILTIIGILSRK